MLTTIIGLIALNITVAIFISFCTGVIGFLYFKHYHIYLQKRTYKLRIIGFLVTFTLTLTTILWLSIMCWAFACAGYLLEVF